MRPKIVIENS